MIRARETHVVRPRLALGAALVALAILAPASSAVAAPDLSVSASHSPGTFLRVDPPNTTVYGASLTLTVRNTGSDPTDGSSVSVTDTLPAGLAALANNPGFGAGPVAASGPGWTCAGTTTSTCTRSDVLGPGASYPPIKITVRVAASAAALLTNSATAVGGGDTSSDAASDAIPVQVDACPNGWSSEETVSFGPPAPAIDSGVRNPERPDGCTLLDLVWNAEPFASHGAFVDTVDGVTDAFVADGLLTAAQKDAVQSAAARSSVGTKSDHQIDDSCSSRVALSLDDGPSVFRPETLQLFREKQVTGNFFDVGFRIAANPQWPRFELREGHVVLNHTAFHPHLNALFAASPALVTKEVLDDETAIQAAAGAPFTFKGLRPPFFEANTGVLELLTSLGYTSFTSRIETTDYEPTNTPQQTITAIVNQLRPGAIIVLHDGPADTPAGANTEAALGPIIDQARALGYCFGKLDRRGNVVASRHVSTGAPIPPLANPVPYLPLVRQGTPPDPWTLIPQPLAISATHSPSTFTRGDVGDTLTLTASNVSDDPTDGSTITVRDAIPSGLTATAASGPGWTCAGSGTRTCTRTDVLGPHASYPPVTITVNVSSSAPDTITNSPTVTGHGGNVWVGSASDSIGVAGAPGG